MRSTIAATKRGSGTTAPHSLNGKLLASPILALSSLSVMIGTSNSAPRGSIWTYPIKQKKIQAAVMGHDAGQDLFVGGLDEFVDQLAAGDVADLAALLAGGQPETAQRGQ